MKVIQEFFVVADSRQIAFVFGVFQFDLLFGQPVSVD